DLGCYGAEYETPNVDALADTGVRCTDWHGGAPVCSPSRASLLTGRYPANAGVRDNVGPDLDMSGLPADQPTLPSVLHDAGYRTGAFGKWHLGGATDTRPGAHGFEEFFGHVAGCVDYYSHVFYYPMAFDAGDPVHDLWDGEEEVWHNGEYLTELITDRATEFVENNADEQFFAYVPYNAPHYPCHAPMEYMERFADLDDERQIVAGMVAAVDDGVGRILDALERTGQRDDTVVVFTSDHGHSRESWMHLDGSGDPFDGGSAGPFRGHKKSLFEGGIRVPAIVNYPGVLDGGVEFDGLASHVDLLPTLAECCGVDVPSGLDGRSLLGAMRGDEALDRTLFWERDDWERCQVAVRDDDWKLVVNARESTTEPSDVHLSNLARDPGESTNLADEEPERVEELSGRLAEWYEAATGKSPPGELPSA
ncbi:MAG: sulfatase, partial [Halobacteriales archaeon]